MLPHVSGCVAFEPRSAAASELRAMAAAARLSLQVEQVALSDSNAEASLRMLVEDLGRSTIETQNELVDRDGSAQARETVPTRTLDSYEFEAVGFIKIDVEGHELAVLRGATQLLTRQRPRLLIESEERHHHNAVGELSDHLKALGYAGFFRCDGSVLQIDTFDAATHQDTKNIGGWRSGWERKGLYINNFVFVNEHDPLLSSGLLHREMTSL
jgi:FkbM family methyltransferase